MHKIEDELPLFQNIMKAVASLYGERCEVVLHDWSKSYDETIVAIEGNLTHRKIGDCGSNLGLEVMRGTISNGDRYNYVTRTKDNKLLRSSTAYIRNDDGEVIGAFCINLDITDFIEMREKLDGLAMTTQGNDEEFFANDVNELLDYLIAESVRLIDKPVDEMTRDEKRQAIHFLDRKGAFLITKSGPRVCDYFNISKYTLYNYLNDSHSTDLLKNPERIAK